MCAVLFAFHNYTFSTILSVCQIFLFTGNKCLFFLSLLFSNECSFQIIWKLEATQIFLSIIKVSNNCFRNYISQHVRLQYRIIIARTWMISEQINHMITGIGKWLFFPNDPGVSLSFLVSRLRILFAQSLISLRRIKTCGKK